MSGNEQKVIEFTACKHLDFSDNYLAKKNLITHQNEIKVCWNRPVIDNLFPRLVQFCKLRGRLNYPNICLSEQDKLCSEYEDFEHKVNFHTIDME